MHEGGSHGRYHLGLDGSADISQVLEAAHDIARSLRDYAVVVTKSTVPVGTADRIRAWRVRDDVWSASRQGATVTAQVTPLVCYVRSIEPVSGS